MLQSQHCCRLRGRKAVTCPAQSCSAAAGIPTTDGTEQQQPQNIQYSACSTDCAAGSPPDGLAPDAVLAHPYHHPGYSTCTFMAARRRCRRRFRVAKGSAGLATRHVSSRNTRPSGSGMAYRKEGTSLLVPHSPLPPAGCSSCASLLVDSCSGRNWLGCVVSPGQMLSLVRALHFHDLCRACCWPGRLHQERSLAAFAQGVGNTGERTGQPQTARRLCGAAGSP